MNTAQNDKIIKELFDETSTIDEQYVLSLFISFLPSYTLDYTAPAKLGLAAWLVQRLPHKKCELFNHVAELYFQLGVENSKEFLETVNWSIENKRKILSEYGSDKSVEWLIDNKPRLSALVAQTFHELERDFHEKQEETAVL